MNTPVPAPETTPGIPSHHVMQQAAEWYALLGSEDLTERDRVRWQVWLDADPEHRLAWGYVESVSRRFVPIQSTVDPRSTADGLWQANTRLLQRRRILAGLVGIGLLGWASWRYPPLADKALAWRADYRTRTGEIRTIQLSDGTQIWLNTATTVNQHYADNERRLQLLAGEILIDTASDPARPFLVDTPHGQLRALGTRFSVRLNTHDTLLAVHAGAVQVTTHDGEQSLLQAGQQTHFNHHGHTAIQPSDDNHEAWSRGVLVAPDISLREVVEELGRYRKGYLGVAPEVADLRVFGSFPLADTDAALAMLADALPVRIQRTLPWWVSIEAVSDIEPDIE